MLVRGGTDIRGRTAAGYIRGGPHWAVGRGVWCEPRLASFSLLLEEGGDEPGDEVLLAPRERDSLLEDAL
jgi:hypothetical protein